MKITQLEKAIVESGGVLGVARGFSEKVYSVFRGISRGLRYYLPQKNNY